MEIFAKTHGIKLHHLAIKTYVGLANVVRKTANGPDSVKTVNSIDRLSQQFLLLWQVDNKIDSGKMATRDIQQMIKDIMNVLRGKTDYEILEADSDEVKIAKKVYSLMIKENPIPEYWKEIIDQIERTFKAQLKQSKRSKKVIPPEQFLKREKHSVELML